jgi:hypothetical protein
MLKWILAGRLDWYGLAEDRSGRSGSGNLWCGRAVWVAWIAGNALKCKQHSFLKGFAQFSWFHYLQATSTLYFIVALLEHKLLHTTVVMHVHKLLHITVAVHVHRLLHTAVAVHTGIYCKPESARDSVTLGLQVCFMVTVACCVEGSQ